MATATVVQDWVAATTGSAGSPANATVNLGVTATTGSLLLAVANSDATVGTPSGWTLVTSSVHNAGCYLFGKISVGTETGVTVTPTSAASTCAAIAELSGMSGATVALIKDATASNGTSGGVYTLSTGTTGTTAQADEYAVAVWGYSAGQAQLAGGGNNQWSGLTNSYVEKVDVGTTKGSGTNVGLCIAVLDLSATGTTSSTATAAGAGAYSSESLIGTFKVAALVVSSPRSALIVPPQAVQRSRSW